MRPVQIVQKRDRDSEWQEALQQLLGGYVARDQKGDMMAAEQLREDLTRARAAGASPEQLQAYAQATLSSRKGSDKFMFSNPADLPQTAQERFKREQAEFGSRSIENFDTLGPDDSRRRGAEYNIITGQNMNEGMYSDTVARENLDPAQYQQRVEIDSKLRPDANNVLDNRISVQNNELDNVTSRRGQDINSSDQRRGQDINSSDQRRGQDITANTSLTNNSADNAMEWQKHTNPKPGDKASPHSKDTFVRSYEQELDRLAAHETNWRLKLTGTSDAKDKRAAKATLDEIVARRRHYQGLRDGRIKQLDELAKGQQPTATPAPNRPATAAQYAPETETGISAVMKAAGITREQAILYLRQQGRL